MPAQDVFLLSHGRIRHPSHRVCATRQGLRPNMHSRFVLVFSGIILIEQTICEASQQSPVHRLLALFMLIVLSSQSHCTLVHTVVVTSTERLPLDNVDRFGEHHIGLDTLRRDSLLLELREGAPLLGVDHLNRSHDASG